MNADLTSFFNFKLLKEFVKLRGKVIILHIEKVIIRGYKTFQDFEMEFNKGYNVIIGDNEAGKSTVLEALDIVLNQSLFNFESSNFEQYFNYDNKRSFQENPVFDNLPEIEIEVFLSGTEGVESSYFNGYHSSESNSSINGIKFTYRYNEEFKSQFSEFGFSKDAENNFIPTDYYTATWNTFSGRSYHRRKTPLKTLLIDNSIRVNNIFNSYSKQVYNNKLGIEDRNKLSHSLKESIEGFVNDNRKLLEVGEYSFGIDERKSYIEQLIDLQSSGISLQNMGKGKESLIKTEIALENTSDLILIEEPENHLSYINTRKLIERIRDENVDAQVIITTHSPLVVSRMNLKNTLWINNDKRARSLKDIPEDTANFFERTDNLDILNFILSKKAILVEGHSEYVLLPFLVKNSFNSKTLDSEGVEVFSGAGLTYGNYIEVSKVINNKLLIITDNDKSTDTIDSIDELNNELKGNYNIQIQCDSEVENFTFEVCLYNENEEVLKDISLQKSKTQPEYKGEEIPKDIAYMLKNKTESALHIVDKYSNKIKAPTYIKEGVEWLMES